MAQPFRFAVHGVRASSGTELRELARKAEALGYSTFNVADHFVDHPLAPVPTCAMVAEATTTLRVGFLVLGNDYRHPVVTAADAATVDLLSDGRLELGIGAGWMATDYEKAGIPYDAPGVRIERLMESVAIIKGLFADGEFTYDGRYYNVDSLDGQPKPVQRPHPPFVIGGGGRRMLSYAAQEADIVGINALLRAGLVGDDATKSLTAAATDEKVGWVRMAAGDRLERLELQSLIGFVHVTDDRSAIADGLAQSFGVPPEVAFETPAVLIGSVEQMIDEVIGRRERWGINYQVVPADAIDAFAPVVAALAGK